MILYIIAIFSVNIFMSLSAQMVVTISFMYTMKIAVDQELILGAHQRLQKECER